MQGYEQELINQANMEFVQFWRNRGKKFQPYQKETLKEVFRMAYLSGAIAATKLAVLGFDLAKEKHNVQKDKEKEEG